MALKYTIAEHAVAFPTKVLARNGGKHIYSIQLTADHDNGQLVGKGDFIQLDLYKEAVAPEFAGKVVAQAANGNQYVEVTADTDALFIYQQPITAEEWTNTFKLEKNFYNAKDDVVRAYELAKGDIVEVSKDGFELAESATLAVGKAVAAGTNGKFKIGA